jgi:peroxiredoxin
MKSIHRPSPRCVRSVLVAGMAVLIPVAFGSCGGEGKVSASTIQDASTDKPRPAPEAAPDDPAAEATPTTAELGKAAPDFELPDLSGREHKLSDYVADGKLVVLEWFNPDCPIAKAYHHPENQMVALAAEFADRDVVWLAINSGAEGKQGAGLERNRRAAEEYGITYPVLLDMDGEVGHRFDAKTTPHMYVIDTKGVLRYAGAIDNGDPRTKGDVNYVRQALKEILAGEPVTTPTSKPFGCSVKYDS